MLNHSLKQLQTARQSCCYARLQDASVNVYMSAAGGADVDGGQSGGETEPESSEDSGESTRLKLQTPLFVADALVQAAERQLDLEKTYCEEEVHIVHASILTPGNCNINSLFHCTHSILLCTKGNCVLFRCSRLYTRKPG